MTERFTNNSPGALTMEQAIERHKKSIAEYKRQLRQARELAAQGRGSDTEIAHVTPGEIVLPEALQTPAVLTAIRQAAMDAEIPLEQLRVGSTQNSINPRTGQPEFAIMGGMQNPIAGYQPPNPFNAAPMSLGSTPGPYEFGRRNMFGAPQDGQPTPPPDEKAPPSKSDNTALERFLAGLSKSELQGLKSALNRAAATTGVLDVFVGGALVALGAGGLLITVTMGGLAIAVVGFSYFANLVDEYLSKQ